MLQLGSSRAVRKAKIWSIVCDIKVKRRSQSKMRYNCGKRCSLEKRGSTKDDEKSGENEKNISYLIGNHFQSAPVKGNSPNVFIVSSPCSISIRTTGSYNFLSQA